MALSRDDRTEAPTPRRRQEARERGQVARSQDLTAAALLLAGSIALQVFGGKLVGILILMVESGLRSDHVEPVGDTISYAATALVEASRGLAPLALICLLAGIVVLVAQVGLMFTWQPLKPSLAKINPLSGLQRLFSARAIFNMLINLVKVLTVCLVGYLSLRREQQQLMAVHLLEFGGLVTFSAEVTLRLATNLSVVLFILALLDYAWQKYRHEQDLKMTKEEVRDELRSMEGDPQIKRRRRQIQLQMALHRLRRDVPKADVVVTNPTHVAIAIGYDATTMLAPKVIAKGADYAALRIRQIAVQNNIPVVERKLLARAIYETVEVGQYLPERFYRAIAEILAYVYEISGRARAIRGSATIPG